MKAIVAAPAAPYKIEIREVEDPKPLSHQAVIEVRASSLNRGEVRALSKAEAGWRPGWDVSGVVLAPALDGSGPKKGAHVVGLMAEGGWAERVAVETTLLAEIPGEVTFSQASTLPVAGLTALRSLAMGGLLLGKKVLITGATGGVGSFAIPLARLAGAEVVGVRRADQGFGSGEGFDLILESVGGASLAEAFRLIKPGGTIVSYGNSSGQNTTFDSSQFYPRTGATLRAFRLFEELQKENSGTRDLTALARLLAQGDLKSPISIEVPWGEVGPQLEGLMNRKFQGKAVMLMK